MGLVASLSDFSASQIFFLLARYSKTGRVEVRSAGEKGEVYFVKGAVTHAFCKKLTGIEALYNLSIFSRGQIEFFPDEKTAEVSIKDEVPTLIGEIERRKVELNEIKEKLPPFDTVLVKSPNPPKDAVALRKDDWKILVLMDGKKNIKETIEKTGIGVLNVYKTIVWLLEKGLIYDPKEVERILKEKITFINILFRELVTLGIGEKEWIKHVRDTLDKSEAGKRLLENIVFSGAHLLLKAKKKMDISKNEIEELFSQVVNILQERCKEEFGPMLAKAKFNGALKKLNERKR